MRRRSCAGKALQGVSGRSRACGSRCARGRSFGTVAAMQNLRDKLLKAGLVSEKDIQDAERKKRDDKPKPASFKARVARESEEDRQRREAFAAREAEHSEERRKEAAKKAEARMQSERAHKIRQIVESNRVREPSGAVSFHFVKRSGKIGRLAISAETAKLLEAGAAAIVEDPGQPEPAVVPGAAAQRVYAVDPHAIRFWNGPEKPIGFEEPPGDA
jgi:uncharacterized protein YaiL (DUF2058 family)